MSIEIVTEVTTEFKDVTLTSLQLGSADLVQPKKWPAYSGGMLDRNKYLSASEMTKCLRQAFYGKKGDTGIAAFQSNGYAERGNAIEAWIVERLSVIEKQGYKLRFTGGNQRSFYDSESGISGTPDGLLTVPGENGEGDRHILLEFKSIDPRANRRNLPKKAHVMQVQINMWLMSLCLGIEVTEARLIYIDASDLFSQKEYVVRYHSDYIAAAHERAEMLHGAGSADDLEPEGLKTGDCDTCPFGALCSANISTTAAAIKSGQSAGFFAPAEATVLTNSEANQVLEFLELRKQAEALDALLEEAKAAAKIVAMKHGNTVVVDDTVLSLSVSPGKLTLDRKAIAAAGIDLSAYEKVGAPFTIMRIK